MNWPGGILMACQAACQATYQMSLSARGLGRLSRTKSESPYKASSMSPEGIEVVLERKIIIIKSSVEARV